MEQHVVRRALRRAGDNQRSGRAGRVRLSYPATPALVVRYRRVRGEGVVVRADTCPLAAATVAELERRSPARLKSPPGPARCQLHAGRRLDRRSSQPRRDARTGPPARRVDLATPINNLFVKFGAERSPASLHRTGGEGRGGDRGKRGGGSGGEPIQTPCFNGEAKLPTTPWPASFACP